MNTLFRLRRDAGIGVVPAGPGGDGHDIGIHSAVAAGDPHWECWTGNPPLAGRFTSEFHPQPGLLLLLGVDHFFKGGLGRWFFWSVGSVHLCGWIFLALASRIVPEQLAGQTGDDAGCNGVAGGSSCSKVASRCEISFSHAAAGSECDLLAGRAPRWRGLGADPPWCSRWVHGPAITNYGMTGLTRYLSHHGVSPEHDDAGDDRAERATVREDRKIGAMELLLSTSLTVAGYFAQATTRVAAGISPALNRAADRFRGDVVEWRESSPDVG